MGERIPLGILNIFKRTGQWYCAMTNSCAHKCYCSTNTASPADLQPETTTCPSPSSTRSDPPTPSASVTSQQTTSACSSACMSTCGVPRAPVVLASKVSNIINKSKVAMPATRVFNSTRAYTSVNRRVGLSAQPSQNTVARQRLQEVDLVTKSCPCSKKCLESINLSATMQVRKKIFLKDKGKSSLTETSRQERRRAVIKNLRDNSVMDPVKAVRQLRYFLPGLDGNPLAVCYNAWRLGLGFGVKLGQRLKSAALDGDFESHDKRMGHM
jgi:hypothetical protein